MAKAKKLVPKDAQTADEQKQATQNEGKEFVRLKNQINSEYSLSYFFTKPRWEQLVSRLKLYNNQKRDPKAIGDPLMFTIFQTVLASLYDDRLIVDFGPRERGDIDVSESLNNAAEFDFTEMKMERLVYDWDFDSLMTNRGLVDMNEYDRKRLVPKPYVIDPLCSLRDPRAVSIAGDNNGRNSSRFHGEILRMTKAEMEETGLYFNLDDLTKPDADSFSINDDYRQIRQVALGYDTKYQSLKGDNAEFRIRKWYTRYNKKLVCVYLANEGKTVIRYNELKDKFIPIIDRPCYPMSHDWDGVSIPDIVEDKQRARSVLANLSMKTAEASTNPMYLFDTNKIKNRNDLNFGFNKHIPVDGPTVGALEPVQRAGVSQSVTFILDFLDMSAQRAMATPEIQQGQVSSQQRTLGELQLVERKVDTRYSLAAKVWGWSEADFWQRWYVLYKRHFKDGIDEKTIRINGAHSPSFRTLTRENLIGMQDPDITVKSKIVAESERFNKAKAFSSWVGLALSDPNANKRLAIKRLGVYLGLHRDDVENIMPPTVDELKAEVENIRLSANVPVEVEITDDHLAHFEVNIKSADTPATVAHLNAHKRAMMMIKMNPALQPGTPPSQAPQPNEQILTGMATQPTGQTKPTPSNQQAGASAPAAGAK